MSFNLATMLRESAAAHPDKTLVHAGDAAFTFAEVDELAGRVATSLTALGLERGDKVAVQLPNLPQFLFSYFGILRAGLTMVPLNPLLTSHEIAYHLADSDAKVLITFEGFADAALAGAAQGPGVTSYVVSAAGNPAPEGARDFRELLAAEDTGIFVATSADDTAVLLYTSGTTGKPKGAELTHFQLFMNCTTAGNLFGVRQDDVSLGVLPLFHVFGLSSVLNMVVRFGATLVLVPRFEAKAVLDAMEKHRVTIFSGVPTMFIALLQEEIAGRDLSALRASCSGGASMPGEVIRAFEEKYDGVVVLEGYGLSESASTATFNISAEERRVLSIGKPIWGVDMEIRGEQGEVLPTGPDNVGEIVIRGHNIMKGYYKRPEETAKAIRNGWFHTGDLGYRDDDGFFFVVDRLKDLVIRGGYNVYPREVEEVLYAHADVVEAAVIGKPDDRLGEEVVAYVALRPGAASTADDLTAWCRERLAAYKYPREMNVVPALPKGPTGKILKRELRSTR
jgi:long-chain acyl-CoA synthetase